MRVYIVFGVTPESRVSYGEPNTKSEKRAGKKRRRLRIGSRSGMSSIAASPSSSGTHRRPVVIVEGNIGAGKSTLCRQLANEMNFTIFLELEFTSIC